MASNEWVEHCSELLAPLGAVRVRRMFGGHGFYVDELFIAILAGDRLYLKTGAAQRPAFEAAGCEPFVYNAREQSVALGYWSAPSDAMESPALMLPWARLALQAALTALATRAAKHGKARKTTKGKAKAGKGAARVRKTG